MDPGGVGLTGRAGATEQVYLGGVDSTGRAGATNELDPGGVDLTGRAGATEQLDPRGVDLTGRAGATKKVGHGGVDEGRIDKSLLQRLGEWFLRLQNLGRCKEHRILEERGDSTDEWVVDETQVVEHLDFPDDLGSSKDRCASAGASGSEGEEEVDLRGGRVGIKMMKRMERQEILFKKRLVGKVFKNMIDWVQINTGGVPGLWRLHMHSGLANRSSDLKTFQLES